MDIQSYFESLGREIDSLKQRVRQLIAGRQWQIDGEWKESVVRQVLRRHLPSTALVGRGFVITREVATTQIDVLVYDGTKPILFRDGDLVFVTPDAVLGLIEVKSKLTPPLFREAAGKLALNIRTVRLHPNLGAFSAVFGFEAEAPRPEPYLQATAEVAERWDDRLSFAAIGPDRFIRYWHFNPLDDHQQYESWHSYAVPGRAHGYFVNNVVDAVSPESVFSNNEVWFPDGGKEPHRDGYASGAWFRAG